MVGHRTSTDHHGDRVIAGAIQQLGARPNLTGSEPVGAEQGP